MDTFYTHCNYAISHTQPQNIDTICHSVIATAQLKCPSLCDEAETILFVTMDAIATTLYQMANVNP